MGNIYENKALQGDPHSLLYILTLVPALIIRQEKPVHFEKLFQVCRPVDRDIKSTSHTRRDMGMSQNEVLFFC